MVSKVFGLIINPIAGMGGKVALKGTDGEDILAAARARGAKPEAQDKAERALKKLLSLYDRLLIKTASGTMGEDICRKLVLRYEVVYWAAESTTASDTVCAAKSIAAAGIDLLIFAGGDGTARNIYEAVKSDTPVLGIPAGVKIQSAVFALDPETAGAIAAEIAGDAPMTASLREVVDLDEDAYRTGHVSAALYGFMLVPNRPQSIQTMKQGGFSSEQNQLKGIAAHLNAHLEAGCYYAVGSGTTAKCLSRLLGLEYELLGVDILRDRQLIVKDATEEQLWQYAKEGNLRIIVSPIGGQGFLFGRGNHQFSASVLEAVGKGNITVVSTVEKLLSIPNYTPRVDCGNPEVNASLHGYYKCAVRKQILSIPILSLEDTEAPPDTQQMLAREAFVLFLNRPYDIVDFTRKLCNSKQTYTVV